MFSSEPVSASAWSDRKKYVDVGDGLKMAYIEMGDPDEDPIVLVHCNPTSSYLWRNVVPHLIDSVRCLAPDLVGMGQSDKLPDEGPRTYSYFVHREYFDGWLDAMNLSGPITFVGHNWGVPLFFYWAMRNLGRIEVSFIWRGKYHQ